jgi:DNA processing protein
MDRTLEILLLTLVPEIGPVTAHRLLRAFPEAGSLLEAGYDDFVAAGLSERMAEDVRCARARGDHRRELDRVDRLGVELLTPAGRGYPPGLFEIRPVPPLLYVRGRKAALSELGVALVGARRCTPYGRSAARRIASGLARHGLTVVSGLARGIDGHAHRASLDASGRTVAVLGCGLCARYPREHVGLAERISEEGAIVSEFPLDAAPLPHHFPRRNRIISGLSAAVVVVEATDRSGSLVTAGWALSQGREVLAVPGPIDSPTSRGVHRLLRDGAGLVEDEEDVLENLGVLGRFCQERREMQSERRLPNDAGRRSATPSDPAELGPREREVLACLSTRAVHIDHLVERTGYPVSVVSALLTLLEMKGTARQLPGKWFVLGDAEPRPRAKRRSRSRPTDRLARERSGANRSVEDHHEQVDDQTESGRHRRQRSREAKASPQDPRDTVFLQ